MATITVRNLDDEVQQQLKRRAAANNRSMEAEVRAILSDSVRTSSLGRTWVELMMPYRGDFELPERSLPRTIDLT